MASPCTTTEKVEDNKEEMSFKEVTSDSILVQIGDFGLFQKLLFVFVTYCILGWSSLNDTSIQFMLAEPAWKCRENSSVCNITGPVAIGNSNYGFRCGIPRHEWVFVDEYKSAVTQFDLVCENSHYIPTLYTCLNSGSIVGGLVMGFISDRFGRKLAYFISGSFATLSMLINRFSPMYAMTAVFVFMQGIGLGGSALSGLPTLLEYIGIKYRGVMGNLIWTSYGFGFMVFGGIAYLARDWRTLLLVYFLNGLPLLFILMRFVPESLRWMIVHKHFEKAQQTLKRIARINGKIISEDIQLPNCEDNTSTDRTGDVRLLFRPGYRIITLVLWYNYLVNAVTYFGLHLAAPNIGGSLYFNWFLAGLSELVSAVIGAHLHTRFERKKIVALFEICAALSLLGSVILMTYDDGSIGYLIGTIICTMVLAKFSITTSFNGILLLNCESYPTVARSIAGGLGIVITNIGAMISGYIAHTSRVHRIMPFVIIAINAFLAATLCFWFLKETKNKQMHDMFPDNKKKDCVTTRL